jgi:hypothetical protein
MAVADEMKKPVGWAGFLKEEEKKEDLLMLSD